MNETIGNFAGVELSARLERCQAWRGVRYSQAYGRLHPEAGSECLPVGGGYAIFVAAHSPVGGARGMGLNGPVSAAEMDEMEDFFRSRGMPPSVHLSPLADGSLLEQLNRRGYRISHFFSVLALLIPADYQAEPPPPGMQITRAQPDEAVTWLQTVARGFEESDSPPPETFEILGPNFYAEDAAPFFAWAVDDNGARLPAAGGGLYTDPASRAAELGGASTLTGYRRRGAQRALIQARLAESLRMGCDLAMVLTSPGSGSQRNLLRAGFWLAYTKPVMVK